MKNTAHQMMGIEWECKKCGRKHGQYGEHFKLTN